MVGSIGWWSKSFTNGKWLLNHDVRPLKKLLGFGLFSLRSYCWWLKSCTTWDVWNPIKKWEKTWNNYLSTGAGYQPSTVSIWLVPLWTKSAQGHQFTPQVSVLQQSMNGAVADVPDGFISQVCSSKKFGEGVCWTFVKFVLHKFVKLCSFMTCVFVVCTDWFHIFSTGLANQVEKNDMNLFNSWTCKSERRNWRDITTCTLHEEGTI